MPLIFTTTPEQSEAISRIVARFVSLGGQESLTIDRIMDLEACHSNGCPLDFAKLEAASDLDLVHDVAGISRHISRTTGKLGQCFLPRCALPDQPEPKRIPAMLPGQVVHQDGTKGYEGDGRQW